MLAVLCGVGIMGAVRDIRAGGDVAWAGAYPVGLRRAQQAHKPLLLSFRTPDCGWCEKLDAETFTDPTVVDLTHRCVCVRVESEVDTALIQKYHVSEFPLTLLLSPEGKPLLRIPGYVPPGSFVPLLRGALEHGLRSVSEPPIIPLDIRP